MEKRLDHELYHRHGRQGPERPRDGHDDFFGMDVEKMSPKAKVTTSLAVIVPVALAGVFLFAFTEVGWIWFTFFWIIFPALRLLVKGIAGLSDDPEELPVSNEKERELLGALREHGELTPARAAMETSLTVAEADEMLKELAEGGHLHVRVRGGGLFYGLWDPGGEGVGQEAARGLE